MIRFSNCPPEGNLQRTHALTWHFREAVSLAKPGEGIRVLVTGGAGFIGSNLVDRLLQLGYKVRIFDNLYTGFIRNVPLDHPDIEYILGNILDENALSEAVEGIDFVYHLAAMSKVVPSLKSSAMARFCTECSGVMERPRGCPQGWGK